jgi:hypothetical protein
MALRLNGPGPSWLVLRTGRCRGGNLTQLECLMEAVELREDEFAVAVVLGAGGLRLRVCVRVGSRAAACARTSLPWQLSREPASLVCGFAPALQQRCRLHGDWAALKARLSSTWDTKEAEDFSQEEEEEDEEEKPIQGGAGAETQLLLVYADAYMAERILAQWEAPSWRPAVWRKFSYVDVNILEIGPRTAAAERLARQRRQLSPQMMGRRPPGEPSGFAGFSSAIRRPPAYSCMWEG